MSESAGPGSIACIWTLAPARISWVSLGKIFLIYQVRAGGLTLSWVGRRAFGEKLSGALFRLVWLRKKDSWGPGCLVWLHHPLKPLGERGPAGISPQLLHLYTGERPRASGGHLFGWCTVGLRSSSGLGVWGLPWVIDILGILPLASPSPFLGKGHQLSQTQKHHSVLESDPHPKDSLQQLKPMPQKQCCWGLLYASRWCVTYNHTHLANQLIPGAGVPFLREFMEKWAMWEMLEVWLSLIKWN